MKKRNLILAGILSGSMFLSMGAMTAGAEESSTQKSTSQTEESVDTSKNTDSSEKTDPSENGESKEETNSSANTDPADTGKPGEDQRRPMPPAFRMRDRAMQPQTSPDGTERGQAEGTDRKDQKDQIEIGKNVFLYDLPGRSGSAVDLFIG